MFLLPRNELKPGTRSHNLPARRVPLLCFNITFCSNRNNDCDADLANEIIEISINVTRICFPSKTRDPINSIYILIIDGRERILLGIFPFAINRGVKWFLKAEFFNPTQSVNVFYK